MSPALRRLQWTVPLLAVAVTGTALAVAGAVAVRSDGAMRDAQLANQLAPRAQQAAALVYYEGGKIVLTDLEADDVATQGVVVLTGTPPRKAAFGPGSNDPAELVVAATAASTEEVAVGDGTGPDGAAVRYTAAAFYDESGRVAGATVVVGDPGPAAREHRRLLAGLGLGGLGGLLVVGFGTALLVRIRVRGAAEAVARPGQ